MYSIMAKLLNPSSQCQLPLLPSSRDGTSHRGDPENVQRWIATPIMWARNDEGRR